MSFLTDFHAHFISQTSLTAVLGTRLYPGMVPTTTAYPYLVYEIGGYQGEHSFDSASEWASMTISIDILSEDYLETENISEAIRNRYEGWHGTMGTHRVGFTRIESIIDNSNLEEKAGNEVIIFRKTIDLIFGFAQPKPTNV